MNLNAHTIIIGIALVLTVASFLKPAWPLLGVAVLLIAVDLLTR